MLLLSILPGSLPYFIIIYKSKRVNFLGLVTSIRKTKHTNYTGLFTTVKLTLSWLWVLIFILSLPTHLTDNLQVSFLTWCMPTRAVLRALAGKHTGPNDLCSVIQRSLVPTVSIIIYITQLAMWNKSFAGTARVFSKN